MLTLSTVVKLVVVLAAVDFSCGFLRRFCTLPTDEARQNVVDCLRQNLTENAKAALEARITELAINESDISNRVCEELAKDAEFKLIPDDGLRGEDLRSLQRVVMNCLQQEATKTR